MSLREQVCDQARLMTQAKNVDSDLLETVAQAAVSSLEARLRSEIAPEDCLSDFVMAAGLFAAAALEDMEGVEQFSAGDVSVRRGVSRAGELRRQAVALMAPWVKPAAVFLGV